jgi:C-terminal processing protease CtpA/Prc
MCGNMYLEKTANWGKPSPFTRAGFLFDSTEQGQKIMTVLPGSPAEVAGLKVGDLVTRIDGKVPGDDINEPAFLQAPGTVVHLTVKRGNSTQWVEITLKNML